MSSYPTIPLSRRRPPWLENADENFPVLSGANGRMAPPMDRPVIGPQEQFGQNVIEDVPQISAQSRMAPSEQPVIPSRFDEMVEPDPTGRVVRQRMQGEAEERALVEPGEQYRSYERVRDTQPEARKGFKGRALAALKGLAYGGFGGAAVGAINPQVIRDYEWRNRDIPEAQRRAEIEQREQGRQLSAGDRMADTTGVNPWTKQPTEQARGRMDSEAYRRDTQAGLAAERKSRDEDRDTGLALRAQAEWDQRHPGQPYPEHVTRALPHLRGEKAPTVAAKAGAPHFVPETGGRMIWDAAQGKMVATPGAEALGPQHDKFAELSAAQQQAIERDQQRQDRTEAQDFTKRAREAEVAMGRAQKAINRAKAAAADTKNWTPEQARQAADDAAVAVEEAMTSHPDLLEGGGPEGGVPYIKWAGGKKPSPQRAGGARQRGQTISQGEYQQQVGKHGQAKVDQWLRSKGIAVQ